MRVNSQKAKSLKYSAFKFKVQNNKKTTYFIKTDHKQSKADKHNTSKHITTNKSKTKYVNKHSQDKNITLK